jgi:hypothetical protein
MNEVLLAVSYIYPACLIQLSAKPKQKTKCSCDFIVRSTTREKEEKTRILLISKIITL